NRIPEAYFEFLFICGVPPGNDLGHQVETMPALTIPFNANYRMVLPFLSNYRTTQQLDQFQPDVIHIATPSPMGHFALRYARTNNIPVISIYHTHFLSYIDYYLKSTPFLIEPTKNVVAKRSKHFYDNCNLVYVPTVEMIKDLAHFGHETNHYKIWQRGLDHTLFNPTKQDQQYLKQITGNDKPNVLFVSRLVWEKNLETLVDFYQKNEAAGVPYNLLIAGDGVAESELKERIPQAYFLGKIGHEKLSILYASADVFLFTSITETYGNVVVEAMASGLPCVIANGGGSKNFIEHGKNGFLCSPNDATDYFERIQQLLSSPNLYQQFVQNGLDCTKDLDWEKLVNIYFEDLRKLVTQKVVAAA
ncbi:MAG: glycosyltransferase family 1 protein, partial [Bacteroidota bacterium]